MNEALQAALDLIDEQQQMLLAQHDAGIAKNHEIETLTAELATFQQADDGAAAVAQRKEWFDAFKGVAAPAPVPVSAEPAIEEPAEPQTA